MADSDGDAASLAPLERQRAPYSLLPSAPAQSASSASTSAKSACDERARVGCSSENEHRRQRADARFVCHICLDVVSRHPVVLACGHLYDFTCIDSWFTKQQSSILSSSREGFRCPACRRAIDRDKDVIPLYVHGEEELDPRQAKDERDPRPKASRPPSPPPPPPPPPRQRTSTRPRVRLGALGPELSWGNVSFHAGIFGPGLGLGFGPGFGMHASPSGAPFGARAARPRRAGAAEGATDGDEQIEEDEDVDDDVATEINRWHTLILRGFLLLFLLTYVLQIVQVFR